MDVAILGCGFTGQRVAARLLDRGARVLATTRHPARLHLPGAEIRRLEAGDSESVQDALAAVPRGALVVHSIPTIDKWDPTSMLMRALGDRPRRVLYISTTAVYGDAKVVDAATPAEPRTERQRLRREAERAVQAGPWESIVLRPAAIYGPGRGVHVSLRENRFVLNDGGRNYISRIHVDDLADHVTAALLSPVQGAWPVADEEPCTSYEIVRFCAELLGVPMPPSAPAAQFGETRNADRRVDGSAIRAKLGLTLRYPSYRVGVPASLGE